MLAVKSWVLCFKALRLLRLNSSSVLQETFTPSFILKHYFTSFGFFSQNRQQLTNASPQLDASVLLMTQLLERAMLALSYRGDPVQMLQ